MYHDWQLTTGRTLPANFHFTPVALELVKSILRGFLTVPVGQQRAIVCGRIRQW
jgi:hypothetical protein